MSLDEFLKAFKEGHFVSSPERLHFVIYSMSARYLNGPTMGILGLLFGSYFSRYINLSFIT